jgi:hypothetical protein
MALCAESKLASPQYDLPEAIHGVLPPNEKGKSTPEPTIYKTVLRWLNGDVEKLIGRYETALAILEACVLSSRVGAADSQRSLIQLSHPIQFSRFSIVADLRYAAVTEDEFSKVRWTPIAGQPEPSSKV